MARGDNPREQSASKPTRFAETTPPQQLPSGDYTYILEIVMNMQVSMGKLIEAVETLKTQFAKHDEKLGTVSADIHTAKVTAKIVGAILAAAIAFAGWAINKGVDTFMQTRQPAQSIQAPK